MPERDQCPITPWCELGAGHGIKWCQLTIGELHGEPEDSFIKLMITTDRTHRRTRVVMTSTFEYPYATPYGVIPLTWHQVSQVIQVLESAQRHSHQRGW